MTVGARKEVLQRISKDGFHASVKEPAERSLANRRVIELVAGHFEIPKGKVRMVNGHQQPSKILSVTVNDDSGV